MTERYKIQDSQKECFMFAFCNALELPLIKIENEYDEKLQQDHKLLSEKFDLELSTTIAHLNSLTGLIFPP